MANYFRVSIKNVPYQQEDLISGFAFEFNASGIAESLSFTQKDLSYDPSLKSTDFISLDVYFTSQPALDFFKKVESLSPRINCVIHQEEEKDWLEEWKKGFHAFEFAKPFWVVPSWCENPTDEKYGIKIDPGMAFGTGTHATTQMCGYFLKKTAQSEFSLLDVGAGSAILSIMGEKLGFKSITAVEIDPEARRVASENVRLNECTKIEISSRPLEEIQSQYEVIVANIIHGTLLKLSADLYKCLKPGGQIFVTGILLEYEDEFISSFIEHYGYQIQKRLEKEGWVGFWLSKP